MMNTRSKIGVVAAALLVATAPRARAQGDATIDPRWTAFVGCWEPDGAPPVSSAEAKARVTCVVPSSTASAVDVVTLGDSGIISREHIDATGQRVERSAGGCTGWESAQWSAEGRELFLRSDDRCDNGVRRTSQGLYAIAPSGDWIDVTDVAAGKGSGVRVRTWRAAPVPSALASELAAADAHARALSTARTAAAGTPSVAEIADASKHLDAQVVQAWLLARREGFSLDATRLRELGDAGVPGPVIDAMVALSYPKQFAILPAGANGAAMPSVRGSDTVYVSRPSAYAYIDPYDPWSLYGYGYPFGYGFGYAPYGYGYGYGYPYGYPYDPWLYGPVVIVPNPGTPGQHGKVVNGHGYTRGTGSSSSGSQDAGGASRSSGGSPRSPSGGESTGRTAHPRPPR